MTGIAEVRIRPLAVDDEAEALAAQDLLAVDGFEFLLERVPGESWSEYVHKLELNTRGEALPPDRVPHSFLVAEVDGRIAGRISVRYELTPYLAEIGGHIGYGVLPEFRRKGVATAMLDHGLALLAEHGVETALITCDADNHASRRTIERAGGRPDLEKPRAYEGQPTKLRFLVATAPTLPVLPDTRGPIEFLAGDRESLEQWLEFYRETLPLKLGGLTARELCVRSVPPSTLSLAGLVRHLTYVERYWFANVVAGEDLPPLYGESDPDGDFVDAAPETAFGDVRRFTAELDASRERAARVADIDAPLPGRRHGRQLNLRWVYVHMIEEYARHLGHVDLLREALDGQTGY